MHDAQLLDGGVAELAERQMDPMLPESLGQSPPGSARGQGREKNNLTADAMQAGCRQQAFLKRLHEVEAGIGPDIAYRPGGKRNRAPP
jgi:hypothetical protein